MQSIFKLIYVNSISINNSWFTYYSFRMTNFTLWFCNNISPPVNTFSSLYKNRYDIGIAVGTEKGLFVPVIRNADRMSFSNIEGEIIEYGNMAKENKLTLEHMKDGTFTISNGGVYGSMLSTPILNTPQSGILGLHNIVKRPWVVNDQIEIRPIMYVALTYDHRIVDGKEAVTFLVRVKEIIENPEQMMFELWTIKSNMIW